MKSNNMKSPLNRRALSPHQHKRTTSRSSTGSVGSNFLAEQYDRDRRLIIHSCFKDVNENQYMTHVRIIEDAKYPSSRPGNDSKLEYKKKRVLIVSSKGHDSKSVFLHKARENNDGSFQIGRTWNLSELRKIERDIEIPEGFILFLTKKYYWQTNSAKERTVFIKTLVKIFTQSFDGHVPELINWDLGLFYLDERSYARAVISSKRPPSQSLNKAPYIANNTSTIKQVSETLEQNRTKNELKHNQTEDDFNPNVTNRYPKMKNHPQYATSTNEGLSITQQMPFDNNVKTSSHNTQSPYRIMAGIAGQRDSDQSKSNFTNKVDSNREELPIESKNFSNNNLHLSYNTKDEYREATMQDLNNIPKRSNNRDRPSHEIPDHPIENRQSEPFQNDSENESQFKGLVQDSQNDSAQFKGTAVINDGSVATKTAKNAGFQIKNIHQETTKYDMLSSKTANLEDSMQKQFDINQGMNNSKSNNLLEDLNALLGENIENSHISAQNNHDDNLNFTEISSDDNKDQLNKSLSEKNLGKELDQSIDNSDISFERGDEVRYSQIYEDYKPHQYHEVTTIQEEEQNNDLPTLTETSIKPIVDDKITRINVKDEMLTEALSDINWTPEFDADTLVELLDTKLKETEYSFNKDLLALQDIGEVLLPYEKSVEQECSRMNPQFHVFLMELNNFAQDIQFVENQHNGLQVESANKKLLWSTLSELLNTVSLDEETLKDLLKCPIRERNLPWMEGQLDLLSRAIKAISGETDNENYNLREMEAMKKRHRYYEKVTEMFLERVVEEMGTLFANINSDTTSNEQLISLLQRLLVFSPLIAFCKEINGESYNEIIDRWNKHILIVYAGIWTKMLNLINSDIIVKLKSEKTITQNTDAQALINQWNIYRSTREFKDENPKSTVLFSELANLLNFIQQHCTVYQNFVNNFFHISSGLTFSEYIQKFKDPASRVIALDKIHQIDSDRESANIEMLMVSKVFQPIMTKFFKFLLELCNNKPSIQPTVMFLLENKIKNLESSNQEFLFTTLKRIFDQLHKTWNEFVDKQCLFIERNLINDFNKDISPIVYSFPIFVKKCEDNLKFTSTLCETENFKNLQVHNIIVESYKKISTDIVKILASKNHTSPSNLNNQPLNEEAVDGVITLLINYNWLIEFLTVLNMKLDGAFDSCLRQCKKAFDVEKDVYSNHLLQDTMQKLKSFVEGAALLAENSNNTVDTATNIIQWSGYSKQNLENILNSYSSVEIKLLVQKLNKHMKEDLMTSKPEIMTTLLVEKCWSCLQGQMVSLYLKLCTLIDNNYRGTRVKFTKNDIIGNFEEYK